MKISELTPINRTHREMIFPLTVSGQNGSISLGQIIDASSCVVSFGSIFEPTPEETVIYKSQDAPPNMGKVVYDINAKKFLYKTSIVDVVSLMVIHTLYDSWNGVENYQDAQGNLRQNCIFIAANNHLYYTVNDELIELNATNVDLISQLNTLSSDMADVKEGVQTHTDNIGTLTSALNNLASDKMLTDYEVSLLKDRFKSYYMDFFGMVDVDENDINKASTNLCAPVYNTRTRTFIADDGERYYNNWTGSAAYGTQTELGVSPWGGRVYIEHNSGRLYAIGRSGNMVELVRESELSALRDSLIDPERPSDATEMYDEFDADIRERGIIPSLINMSENAQGLNEVLENMIEQESAMSEELAVHDTQIHALSRQMQPGDMLSFDGVVEGHVDVNQASLGSGSYRVLYSTTRCAFIVESGGNYYNNWTESYLYGKVTANGVIPWRGRVFYNQANGSLCAVIGGQMIGFRMGENAVEISESLLSVENAHGGIRLTENGTIQTRLGATGQWRRLPTLVCHGQLGLGNLTTTETTLSIPHFTTYNGDMPTAVKLSTGKARFYLPATWNELSLRYENTIRRVTPTAGRCSAQMSNISSEGSRSYFDITTYDGNNLGDITVEIELWLCE